MSFTNDSQYPIVIRGLNKKRSVTFEIWGVPDGRTVTLSDPKISNQQAATEYYEFTDTLAPRLTQTVEYKADGFNSVVVRTVRDSGGNIIHQDTITSSYRKVDGVILVGRYPGDAPAGYQWPASQGIPPPPASLAQPHANGAGQFGEADAHAKGKPGTVTQRRRGLIERVFYNHG